MIDFEFLSDQQENFRDSFRPTVNYEDMNLNVSIPVFSIHGNHDDISGFGRLSSMDVLSSTGLLNYIGRWTDLTNVEISPIVLNKNGTKIAIYALSHIQDQRLVRLFRDKKVSIRKPDIPDEEIFSMMVLHQNRADRGRNKFVAESLLPSFLNLVIWGHEHECLIEPVENSNSVFMCQPGSSVATSLSDGEAKRKHIGILEVKGTKFKMTPVLLKTVRPFIFKTIDLDEYVQELRLNEGIPRDVVTKFCSEQIDKMIEESKEQHTNHPNQPTIPLIRLRILYSNESHLVNTVRFGQQYRDQVANATEVILFKKNMKRTKNVNEKLDEAAFKSVLQKREQHDRVEDVTESYFADIGDDTKKLHLLNLKSMSEICRLLVDKDDEHSAKIILDRTIKAATDFLEDKMVADDSISEAIAEFHDQKSKTVFDEALNEISRADGSISSGSRIGTITQRSTSAISDDDEEFSGTSLMASRVAKAPKGGRQPAKTVRSTAAAKSTRSNKLVIPDNTSFQPLNISKASSSKEPSSAQRTQSQRSNTTLGAKKSKSIYYVNSSESE